jgi:hypothetical protein
MVEKITKKKVQKKDSFDYISTIKKLFLMLINSF